MKSHMRRYLNEGNDINSPSDMKRALDSYGGVKSCRVAAVDVDVSKQVMTDHNWKGIQSLNNFEFLSTGIRVWIQTFQPQQEKIREVELLNKISLNVRLMSSLFRHI